MADYFESGFSLTQAWHGKSEVTGKLLTRTEAMDKSGHAFGVVKEPLMTRDGQQMPGLFVTRRTDVPVDDKRSILSENGVGARYTVVQNTNLYDFFDACTEAGQAVFRNGIVIRDGKVVVLQAELPDCSYTVADWKVGKYLTVINTHDGSWPFMAFGTDINTICWNTTNAAVRSRKNCVSIRHTLTAEAKIKAAHQIMGLMPASSVANAQLFNALANAKMTPAQETSFAYSLFPFPVVVNEAGEETKAEDTKNAMMKRNYVLGKMDDPRYNSKEHSHTGWTAHNALTDLLDHGPLGLRKSTDRNEFSLLGEGDTLRTQSVNWLKAALLGKTTVEVAPEPVYLSA